MKLKTHSGTKKRVKVNGKKRIFFKKPGKNHLLTNKSRRQKELYKSGMPVHDADRKNIENLLPYVKN